MKWWEERFLPVVRAGMCAGLVASVAWAATSLAAGEMAHLVMALLCVTLCLPAFSMIMILPDYLRSHATERTLRLATKTLDQIHGGLTQENCQAICREFLPETKAIAVSITDTDTILGYVGQNWEEYPLGAPIRTEATRDVIKSGTMQTFDSIAADPDQSEDQRQSRQLGFLPAGIIVPVKVQDETVGTIKFYYRRRHDIDKTQLAIAYGLGQILSMELSTHELERQAELAAVAEVKALQAQINPHFLFNTLNTIAALTRIDPQQARNLLRQFSVFYRQTLENSESQIPLAKELEQTRRYLLFEHARFGEDRIVEREHIDPRAEQVLVPSFIIQPIVENAVRHAMRDEGALHIDIHVAIEGQDVLIAVVDDGLGMDEQVAKALLLDEVSPKTNESKGTGIALHNVAERLERFYGKGSGVEIMSREGEGTCVTLRLCGAYEPDQEEPEEELED